MTIGKKTSFVYKTQEEKLLSESLMQSGLVSQEQLCDIKVLYNESVAYHNFLHALKVARSVLQLPTEIYSFIEIRSLFFAALFHDAGHTGSAQILDEYRSVDLAFQALEDFEKKYDMEALNYSIIRKAIIGTVFKNRAKNTNQYAILLADLDIATLGMSFSEFLYYCDFPICIEFGNDINKWLTDRNYFKFLLGVEKQIFRSLEVRKIFPHALSNIKRYIECDPKSMTNLFYIWKSQNISFQDFEKILTTLFEKKQS